MRRLPFFFIALALILARSPAPLIAQTPADDVQAVTAVAMQTLDAVDDARCEDDNPERKPCVALLTPGFALEQGTAVFAVTSADGNDLGIAAFARDLTRQWRFWYRADGAIQLLPWLPGIMVVCTAGAGLPVRNGPDEDADLAGTVDDGYAVTVNQFVLTEPGDAGTGVAGAGWYHLTVPVGGWAPSGWLANPLAGGCSG